MAEKPERFSKAYWMDALQVDDLILLLPKLLCAIWAAPIANSLRKRWWGIIEIILMGKQLPGYIEGLLTLLLSLGLICLVMKVDFKKWVNAICWTIVVSMLVELIVNGVSGLMTGSAWEIPEMTLFGEWVPIGWAMAQRAVREALEKKK